MNNFCILHICVILGILLMPFCGQLPHVVAAEPDVASPSTEQSKAAPAVLQGRITDHDGKPLVGPKVCLVAYRCGWNAPVGEVDANGQFRMESRPGEYVLTCTGGLDAKLVTLRAGQTTTANLQARKPAPLAGKVTWKGKPVANATVTFLPLSPSPGRLFWPPPTPHATIQQGRYRIEDIGPGRYLLRVKPIQVIRPGPYIPQVETDTKRPGPRPPWFVDVITVTEHMSTWDIAIPDNALSGTVGRTSGKGIGSCLLYLVPAEIKALYQPLWVANMGGCDDEGAFRFEAVAPGEYNLVASVYADGQEVHLKQKVMVSKGDTSIAWNLPAGIELNGKMTWDGTKPQLPYMHAINRDNPLLRTIHRRDFDWEQSDMLELSMAPVLPAGTYNVMVMTREFGVTYDMIRQPLTKATTITPRLAPGGWVRVQLTGKPADIIGKTVSLADANGEPLFRLTDPLWSYDPNLIFATILPTGPDGVTYVHGLAPGRYQLSVNGKATGRWVSVTAQKEAEVTLPFSPEK
jgi:hypothetical protein